MLSYFPKYFTSKAITLYIAALVVVNIVFMSHFLPILWWIFGLVEVLAFFTFANQMSVNWANLSTKAFETRIFQTALIIRVVWVFFSYFFYLGMTGAPYEFHAADVYSYERMAGNVAANGFSYVSKLIDEVGISDSGYASYLGTIYMIFGKNVIIPRLIKATLGALAALLIYRLSVRNFGEQAGRMAGIFFMLMPNLIYYTGSHLKEAEMVFLSVAFVERADYLLRSKTYNFINIGLPIVLAGSLFFLRTALGATALFALFTTVVFSSSRVMNFGRKAVLTIWVVLAIVYFAGGKIATEVEQVWENRGENQKNSMETRANLKGGNQFSKYAGGAVFAPLIFVIPFPTMVGTDGQENQQLLNGGNYVKNIMAFFTILALILVIKEKKWRDHLLIGTFTIGYLGIIAMSAFAQSERFHQPALPFILVMAAYGISKIDNKNKKYFTWWMVFIFVALVGWSWFKLAGRGLV